MATMGACRNWLERKANFFAPIRTPRTSRQCAQRRQKRSR
jgi:hypothetical protein